MHPYENYSPEIPLEDLPPVPETSDSKPQRPKRGAKKTSSKPAAKAGKESSPQAANFLADAAMRIRQFATLQNTAVITGLFLGACGIWLLVAFISYLTNCIADQAVVNNSSIGAASGIANAAGEGGARLSEFLINESFGLGSAVIVCWLLAMSLKLLVKWPKFKSVNFTIKCFVALITASLIIGLLTIGFETPVNWGGYHGRYVNEFIMHFVGWPGAALLCIVMAAIFVLICLRDVILWIMRLKRKYDDRRRAAAEARAEQLLKEEKLDQMRAREEIDAVQAGEASPAAPALDTPADQYAAVDFSAPPVSGNDSYEIPDFEDDYQEPESSLMRRGADDEPSASPAPENKTAEIVAHTDPAPRENHEQPQDEAVKAAMEDKMVVNVNEIAEADISAIPQQPAGAYEFPPFSLLRPGSDKISVDAEEQLENKEKIRKTLLDFDIPITSIEATVGPTVTLYEIRPERGVKISKIRNLVDDMALSLSAIGVRIIAPIPGKGTVGIEVANKEPMTVSMRSIIKSRRYQESRAKLPLAIGSTISNDVYISDLAKMPHLLVAGATGQGKSVGLNAIIASLLYCKKPEELKFVMIDPKMVEFSLYAKIEQHYLAKIPDAGEPIITDMTKVVATLSSLCVEMEDRYQLLKAACVRNLEEYNDKINSSQLNAAEGHRFLPYIVVIVDEFSDLIMTAGKEVEMPIARLAQKARAIGIHVIIATQRPSTNVITGIIKANFPARIAFKVSSGVDSKTILDTTGAQLLIGRGDMLASNNSEMVRVQCAFIDTPEVEAICDHIAAQPGGTGAYILPEPVNAEAGEDGSTGATFGERDPLFEEIARTVVMSNTASTSSLQRRYSIGYNRAGKIMDQLEAAGIVGPSTGGKPRNVLVDIVTLESMLDS